MKTPTGYQREVAADVAADMLSGRGSVFTAEIPLGAGVRELASQLEMLALGVNAQAGGSVLRVVQAGESGVKERLVESLRGGALRGLWADEDDGARLGRASVRYADPGQLHGLEGRFELAQALNAHLLSADAVARLQAMAVAGATVVLYGRPRDGATPFERLKVANRESEEAAGRRHFRVPLERAQAELPGYAARVAAAREELGEAHPEFEMNYALRPAASGAPAFPPARLRALLEAGGPRRLAVAGELVASVVITRLPEAGGGALRSASATAAATVASRSGHELRVLDHKWAEAADAPSLARCIARFLSKTWPCERALIRARADDSDEARQVLDDALGARRARWAPNAPERRDLESSALIAAALTGRLSVYAMDGSPEYRALRREMESAALRTGAERVVAVSVEAPDEGFLEGLSMLAVEDAEREGAGFAAPPAALAS